jgi:hypothetical protein
MICPSLPQKNYNEFARSMVDALRIDRMEHVWAEVINVRGESFTKTEAALRAAGFTDEADMLGFVSSNKVEWEQYATDTFHYLSHVIPPQKLRFLQYVTKETEPKWKALAAKGAVLL